MLNNSKFKTLINGENINTEKMNITGSSGRINGVEIIKIIQIGISECDR